MFPFVRPLNIHPSSAAYDSDAQTYINSVEALDGVSLETGVKNAINKFVVNVKADSLWNKIHACCILAGARTLNGCLTPLKGPSPGNGGVQSADYNRKTGIIGNRGVNPATFNWFVWMDTNRAGNASPQSQNNIHMGIYLSENRLNNTNHPYICADALSPLSIAGRGTNGFTARLNNTTVDNLGTGTTLPSVLMVSRGSSASYNWTGLGSTGTQSTSSTGTTANDIFLFAHTTQFDEMTVVSNPRIAFYTIGEDLNISVYEGHISVLIDDISKAIP